MAYRLLALDIDGTLLKSNHRLDKATKDAIQYAKRKGVRITLATERHFYSAKKVAKALKLKEPIIAHNGAYIGGSTETPLYTSKIPYSQLLQLTEYLESYQCRIIMSHEHLAVSNQRQKNLIGKMTIGTTDSLMYPTAFEDSIAGYLHEHHEEACMLEVRVDPDKEEEMLSPIKDFFPGIDLQAAGPRTYQITKAGTSKFGGLVHLANHYNIPMHEVVAVGDDWTDEEMIAKSGLGVAMQDAPEQVRRQADWVTRTNDMNGVAYMIKEVFRKQMKLIH